MSDPKLLAAVPPNSPDAERTVLGAMLMDEKSAIKAFGKLTANDFYLAENREIFDALLAIGKQKQPIDVLTATDELAKRGTLTGIGGPAYLISAVRYVPTVSNIDAYIDIVQEKSMLRRLIAQCRETAEKCFIQDEDIDTIKEGLRAGVRAIEHGGNKTVGIVDVMEETLDYIHKKANGELIGLQTGILSFDQMTGGLMGGELLYVGARPGVGKSVFGMIASIIAGKYKNVMFYSYEMPKVQIGLRMLAHQSGVPMSQLKAGNIDDMQWEPLIDAVNELSGRKIRMDFSFPTVEQLRTNAQQMYDDGGLDLIIVDYLQLVSTTSHYEKRHLEVGAVSRTLKEIALTLQIPVIAMVQVGRDADKRCPSLKDLRESGNLEQDADIVLFLHEPEDETDYDIPPEDMEAYRAIIGKGHRYLLHVIAKHRNGCRGVYGSDFDPDHMTIRCITNWPERITA